MTARITAKGVIPVLRFDQPDFDSAFEALVSRQQEKTEDVEKVVRKIVERVRDGGDKELFACIKKFDGSKFDSLEVTRDEWDDACDTIDPADRAAIGKAAMRIREFHRKRIPSSWEMREEGGGVFGHQVRPLARVGVYVPGGKAVYPSTVIMNTVPASVVEVPEIIMATPAGPDGKIAPQVLMAARVAGVHRVFKMGGAHAVAAMAFGTETVPRVDKIVGPGNIYVATAKKMVFGVVGIDIEAGPTEVLVIADRTATAAWVAADLLSQAEHDEMAAVILITPVKSMVTRVQDQLSKQLKGLRRAKIAKAALSSGSAAIHAKDMNQCIELANRYAPEHLVLAIDDPDSVVKQIENAGAIFLGHYTPVAVGDYAAGPSHVLPTGGTARFASGLSAADFVRAGSVIHFTRRELSQVAGDVARMADKEGLSAHRASVDIRLRDGT